MNLRKIMILTVLMAAVLMTYGFQNSSEHKVLFEKAKFTMETKGDLKGAIQLFKEIVENFPGEREYAAKSQLYIGFCYEKLGLSQASMAQEAFQMVVDNYPEQAEVVKVANEKLSVLLRAKSVIETGSKEHQIRQVWTGKDIDGFGEISSDGKYLSFVDWTTGNLAIRELSTGKKTLLTNKGSWKSDAVEFALSSVWSRDGKQLAYIWVNDAEDQVELQVVGLADQRSRLLHQVNDEKSWINVAGWSPDSKNIVVILSEHKLYQLGVISVSDGSIRILKTFRAMDPHPISAQFSPDGHYIVYDFPQQEFTRKKNIFIISVDGKHEIPLVNHPANDNLLGWSPDGNWILFTSDRTGSWDAWVIQVIEGKPQKSPQLVKRGIGLISPLGFNQNGAFYYTIEWGMYNVFSTKIDPVTGHILEMPKKEPLPYEGYNTFPDWSPDGKHLLYISLRGPMKRERVLCIYALDSGSVREINLKEKFVHFGYPRWCPDSRSILLFAEHLQSGDGVYKVDAKTGEVTLLIQEKDESPGIAHWWAVMTPDGKSLFYDYESSSEEYYQIRVRELKTGKETVLLRHPPHDNNQLALSPDGKQLALILREEENMRMVKVMPAEGGNPVELHRFKLKGRNIVYFDWSPDGRYIYFPKRTPEGWELWRVPARGGDAENLKLKMSNFTNLSIHPDGERITFASFVGDKMEPSIWVMENFLPEMDKKK